ncbi:MAG TPA: asparagine synthase (glutamine-hydrolyzing), partial [Pyrinomonadaceae bacterium]|nr:asparagine synthase (glutamine-hydrolyzing) [Pyrinomonadaceae bacterium]
DVVQRMNDAQRHRGPDDQGVARCGEVVLGNTRLAIIDTTAAGHQPMNDPVTGNWITYNGETYNFKDLRDELSGPWSSNTDTEVVLRAYREFGVDAFRKMRGMFALALWDHQRQTLVLARDPLGIKPLYYYVSENQFVFASELRALLASGLIPRKLSAAGVDSYLANGSVEAPLTIVEGVKQVLPGYVLHVSANDTRQNELTDTEFATPKPQSVEGNREDAVACLRHQLEESVRLHLVSDVPLGVFLSGGMDSSALVALMSRIGTQPKTFSIVFDEPKFTEAPFSRAVAERFNTDHSEIRLSEDRLLGILPAAIASLDQPTMDGINTFVVSSAVKSKGITVALSGLGGDELFAGYPSFRRALRFDAMSQVSKRVLRAASGVGQVALNGSVQRHKFWQLANSGGRPEDVYRISRQLFSADSVMRITGRDGDQPAHNGHHANGDVVNAISRLELTGYMTNTLLRDTDAMSMAHSLEVRVPFVDTRVVDYALSLPGEWKAPSRVGPKPLLADAVADLLPREFLNRPKMGFTLPFEKWLQGSLRGEVGSVLESPEYGMNAPAVRDVWRRFLEKPRAVGWSRPWALYVLSRWCEVNRVS